MSCLRGCKPEGCSRVPKDLVKPHKEGHKAGYRHPPGEVFSKSRQRMAGSTDLQNPCFSPSNAVLALSSYNLTRTSTTMRLSLPDSSYVSKCLHYFVRAWKRVHGDNLKCPSSGAIRLVFRDSILHWPGAGQLGWAGWPWSPQGTSAYVSPALGLQGQTIALGFVPVWVLGLELGFCKHFTNQAVPPALLPPLLPNTFSLPEFISQSQPKTLRICGSMSNNEVK